MAIRLPLICAFLPAAVLCAQPPGTRTDRNLVYSRAGARELLLDLYRPERQAGPLPLVVWVHGGAFRTGRKDDDQVRPALALLEHGYAVASIGYRLSQEALFPA